MQIFFGKCYKKKSEFCLLNRPVHLWSLAFHTEETALITLLTTIKYSAKQRLFYVL